MTRSGCPVPPGDEAQTSDRYHRTNESDEGGHPIHPARCVETEQPRRGRLARGCRVPVAPRTVRVTAIFRSGLLSLGQRPTRFFQPLRVEDTGDPVIERRDDVHLADVNDPRVMGPRRGLDAPVGSTSMDLTLRPTTLEDLPILFEHQADTIGAKMAAFASRDWDAFVAHEAKIRDDRAAIRRTIVVDGEVVGSISCWGDDEREIGYWIGREHWGRGIATASVRAFIAEIPDRPLHAYVAEHNVASMKVVVANGFVQVGRHEDEGVVHLVFRLDPGETPSIE